MHLTSKKMIMMKLLTNRIYPNFLLGLVTQN
jgi:hypothetical protein